MKEKKLKGGKKIVIVCAAVAAVMLATLVGCSNEKQDALLDYINKDLVEIAEIEEKMIESYASVSGTNYTDDLTFYNELNENTIPLCQELNELVLDISPSDEEISDVHKIYRKYVSKYLNALATINSALENQDVDKVVAGNDLLDEANDLATEFQQELRALAKERNVTLNNE